MAIAQYTSNIQELIQSHPPKYPLSDMPALSSLSLNDEKHWFFNGFRDALRRSGTLWAPRDREGTLGSRPLLPKYCVFVCFIEARGWLVRGKNDEKHCFFNGFRRKA